MITVMAVMVVMMEAMNVEAAVFIQHDCLMQLLNAIVYSNCSIDISSSQPQRPLICVNIQ